MMRVGRRSALALAVVVALVAGGYVARDYAPATALVIHAAGYQGWIKRAADFQAQPFSEQNQAIPSRYGPVQARLYRPAETPTRTVLLLPGVHALGIDEPRLVGLARELAADGVAVLTPELPDLKRYLVTPRSTDMIEDTARWAASQPGLSPDRLVGMVGVSFAGGLSVVAAGRPAVRDRVAFVLSLGGHGSLPRVLRYLCTGILPDGTFRPPHDYGVVLILLGAADYMVPADQVARLREAILTFLEASHLDMFDKPRAKQTFERARALEAALPEPSATLMRFVNTRDVGHLGPRLLPYVADYGGEAALSPERSPAPAAPVYLLHGADDNVIPAAESSLLGDYLRSKTTVRALITPLITHAEVDRSATVADVWRLIAFWASVLRQ